MKKDYEQNKLNWDEDTELSNFCADKLEHGSSTLITIGCAAMVVVINQMVKLVNHSLSKYSRFKTLSLEQTANTNLDFVFILINTLIVPFLVSIRYESVVPAKELKTTL